MKWIRSHRLLTGIICTALALCLIIILSFLSKGSSTFAGRQIEKATAFVQRPVAATSQGFKSALNGVFRFRDIVAENEELKDENAELRNEINKIKLTERDLQELRELADVFDYDSEAYDRNVVAANVISLDGTNWYNIFTIDKGVNDGIRRNAVVFNGEGLIGTVMDVGSNWAKVISIIDETNKVSFIVFRDFDMVGIMEGDGNGGLNGFMLDNQAGIMEGDRLITSGMGMEPMYPKGIDIGKVISVNYNMDKQLKTIEIEPFVDFKKLRKVAVII